MKRTLLIVDPQNDFITGALPVPGAEGAMNRLVFWMKDNSARYDDIVVTMDQHPHNHCSFASQGGLWPPHCIRYTDGAAIYPALHTEILYQVQQMGKRLHYIEKATTVERDAYSAFELELDEVLLSSDRIYLCGLAGDYCVAATHRDLLRSIPAERIELLREGIAYINEPQDESRSE